ncbi:hypothetical protein [Clostridium peptidivorans]|uniref:hypothetical protein n=1 Tax=Clostridium peptidivorans TaxID=100174 RepID=UPI0015C7A65F|nr:hypothetical protein [Clostridium peptidivorans]
MNNEVLEILMLSVISENMWVLWYNIHVSLIIVVKNHEIVIKLYNFKPIQMMI